MPRHNKKRQTGIVTNEAPNMHVLTAYVHVAASVEARNKGKEIDCYCLLLAFLLELSQPHTALRHSSENEMKCTRAA